MKPWRDFLAAVSFLTRLPVGRFAGPQEPLPRALCYFPLVGLLIGLATCGVIAGAEYCWPTWLAVIIALGCEALLTGAFHEDAVADFCDAFGGGWTRDDILRILKDSRIGAYGMVGLLFLVALRGGSMYQIVSQYEDRPLHWLTAIVASTMLGRWAIILTMTMLPPVENRSSLAEGAGGRLPWQILITSTATSLPVAAAFLLLMPVQSLLAVGAMAFVIWRLLHMMRHKLGGLTGDCLGSVCYITQVAVLLAAAAEF